MSRDFSDPDFSKGDQEFAEDVFGSKKDTCDEPGYRNRRKEHRYRGVR